MKKFIRMVSAAATALAVIAVLLLLWTQETVLAAEQTYTIDDETSYETLKAALRISGNSKISFDDDTKTITVDFDGICYFKIDSLNRINLSQQAKDFVNELFANSGNLKSVTLKRVRLEGIQLQNLSNKTSMETLIIINCGLDSFPDIKLDNLTYMDVSENPFGNSDTVERYLTDDNFGELKSLTMHSCALTSVPNIKLPKLEVLIMSENDFSAAGACDNLNNTNFKSVYDVRLDGCGISDVDFLLTGQIGRQLTVLSLGTNKLTNDSLNGLFTLKNELSYLVNLNVGCRVSIGTGTTIAGGGYNSNKITDIDRLASLFIEFPALTSLDVSGLGITSLQEFSYVENLARTVSLYADYNEITDFAGLENTSGNHIYLYHQSITLPEKFNPGEEYEIPDLLQRILDQNDVLKGTLSYQNCSLSDDGTKLVIKPNVGGAWVTVAGGKLDGSKIQFSLRRIPSYTIPQDLTATVGDTLTKVTLPSGFTWKDATMNVGAEGTNTFEAVYTPQDTDRYMTVSVNIPVKVTDPNKPTEPVTDPTEPVKPTEPVTDPTEPVKPSEPVTDPADPTKPSEPVTDPTDPTKPTESPKPVTEPDEPDEPDEPATEPINPVVPKEPVTEPTAAPTDEDENETASAGAVAAANTSDTSPVLPVTAIMLVSGIILCFVIFDKKNRFNLNK